MAYSKTDVTRLIPETYLPKTVFVNSDATATEVGMALHEKGMTLPLIIKPDMGERGKGVKILRTEEELEKALSNLSERMLLQTYEDLPMELGVMYSRKADEAVGRITSVVLKDFPVVIGDGKSTLLELILKNLRTRLSYEVHLKRLANRLHEVPAMGERVRVVNIGNHMLGTTFNNGNHLITPELVQVFDQLAKQVRGFHLGRFDIRTESIEELLKGNFKVIELNGVNSEPCHIFHPGRSIFLAWRDLFRHWNRIYHVSVANHKNGVPYASYAEIRKEIKRHDLEVAKYD